MPGNIAQPGEQEAESDVIGDREQGGWNRLSARPRDKVSDNALPHLATKVALCNIYNSRALLLLYTRAIIPQPNYNVQSTRMWVPDYQQLWTTFFCFKYIISTY